MIIFLSTAFIQYYWMKEKEVDKCISQLGSRNFRVKTLHDDVLYLYYVQFFPIYLELGRDFNKSKYGVKTMRYCNSRISRISFLCVWLVPEPPLSGLHQSSE